MSTLPKISREVLESYLRCRTKGFLTLIGEPGAETEYETWSHAVATQQKINATANFIAHYREATVREDIAFGTLDATDAPDALLNVRLDTETVSLSVDALVRDRKSTSRAKKNAYTPVLFSNRTETTQRNVLLGVVACVVSQLQGKECSTGIIFHEGRRPSTVLLTDGIRNKALIALSDLEALRQGSAPSLVLNEHCQVCKFSISMSHTSSPR
jgi:hypothetical protein